MIYKLYDAERSNALNHIRQGIPCIAAEAASSIFLRPVCLLTDAVSDDNAHPGLCGAQ